jgi:hypothetical protein
MTLPRPGPQRLALLRAMAAMNQSSQAGQFGKF